ncbi:MAG: DUF4199 domain-containing protein [Flammeovirgaceae bacterium]
MNSVVKYGVICAAASIVLSTILYVIGPEVFIDVGGWLSLVIIGLYVYFGLELRKENGGYFTFGQAFKSLFTMMIVSGVISTVYRWLLFNVFDTNLGANIKDIMMERLEAEYEKAGMDPDAMEMALSFMDEWEFGMNMNGINTGITIVSVVIGSLILAAIIGAIIKKKNPQEFDF